jgi:hypothetical protein
MMTCRAFLEQLDDLVADTLPPELRSQADDHLRICPPCVIVMQTYQVTIRLTRQLSGPGDPSTNRVDE